MLNSQSLYVDAHMMLETGFKQNTMGLFYKHGLTLIPAWISYYMAGEVWDEITYPFPNFNDCTYRWSLEMAK